MRWKFQSVTPLLATFLCALMLIGCGAGSDSASADLPDSSSPDNTSPDNSAPDGSSATDTSLAFADRASTARFLTQATFGPTPNQLNSLTGSSPSAWFRQQLQLPMSSANAYRVEALRQLNLDQDNEEVEDTLFDWYGNTATMAFWRHALGGQDQLRQRMAFALSQILVVSDAGGEQLADHPASMTYYQDLMNKHALGNYRALLEDVTYSPAMGYYLTYMGNRKGDPNTGRMPDENYARELLQLFTIGLYELNSDGSVRLGADGKPLETYTNADITGLARVFTGLNMGWDDDTKADLEESSFEQINAVWSQPMRTFAEDHSGLEKRFLTTVIPAGTSAQASISQALDGIFSHPNLGPFIGRQLIQRLVTSNPTPQYVARVAQTFDQGSYRLPDGSTVGSGQRGDLAATAAAILFDSEARDPAARQQASFGKVREPVLRFTAWARAFGLDTMEPEYLPVLWHMADAESLSQHPYRSPSVFNFFRPGYVAPGTVTGAQGLMAPELQIVNSASTPGYINTMAWFVFNEHLEEFEESLETFGSVGLPFDANQAVAKAQANYSDISTASVDDIINQVAERLTFSELSLDTRERIRTIVQLLPQDDPEWRVAMAAFLVTTSTDLLVQR
jgi:uncharacterized protein (DUF1800 family)